MKLSRRGFLGAATFSAASLSFGAEPAAGQASGKSSQRIKLGISTYSYWHFRQPKVSIETVIEKSAGIGVGGVDILHRQMNIEEKAPFNSDGRAYCNRLKRLAFANGIDLICLSTHQNFVSPKPEVISENVEHTKKCIDIAYQLGIPCIRINTGRWNTVDFDKLMANRGIEPILPGHTEEEGFKWCIDGIQRCLPKAEESGVMLALENHWGLARTPEGLLRIVNAINSPWLGVLMDTGNFLEDPYDKLAMIAPKTCYVQAKTYFGGGLWYSLDLDYKRIAQILRRQNYHGYIALEFEGNEDWKTAIPKSLGVLRGAFSAPGNA